MQFDMPPQVLHDLLGDIVGQSGVMDEAAEDIAARARANAAGHGSLDSRVVVETVGRGKDRMVWLDHGPETGHIEYGHMNSRSGQWVPGLRVMRNTYEQLPGVVRP